MLTANEIIEKQLKDGREYLYIGGQRYRKGDCFLSNGREVTIKEIVDGAHFTDDRNQFWHSYMFYDFKCEHCFERNADKKTLSRTSAAIIADNAELERNAFRLNMIQNYKPYQIYDEHLKVNFYESMYRYFLKCGREPSTELSDALLKKGDNLIADMYRHYAYRDGKPSIGTKSDIDRFVKGYLGEQELC